jgi:hypothetical protein
VTEKLNDVLRQATAGCDWTREDVPGGESPRCGSTNPEANCPACRAAMALEKHIREQREMIESLADALVEATGALMRLSQGNPDAVRSELQRAVGPLEMVSTVAGRYS